MKIHIFTFYFALQYFIVFRKCQSDALGMHLFPYVDLAPSSGINEEKAFTLLYQPLLSLMQN